MRARGTLRLRADRDSPEAIVTKGEYLLYRSTLSIRSEASPPPADFANDLAWLTSTGPCIQLQIYWNTWAL